MLIEHRIIVDLINKYQCKTIAEIGVWKGDLVTAILNHTENIIEYFGVDPFQDYDIRGGTMAGRIKGTRTREETKKEWNRLYKQVLALTQEYPQFKLIREESAVGSAIFQPEYFDLVYVDGNHLYGNTKQDIELWMPLVKIGGILCGHDYNAGYYKGVKKAVDELLPERKILGGNTWKVIKT